MEDPIVLFRCDASPQIGGGHVNRCMALAETLAESGWRVIFAVSPETIRIVPALTASNFIVRECRTSADALPQRLAEYASGHVDFLVVDHYDIDASFEQACRPWARRILVLDDGTGRRHDCDLLVDAAIDDPAGYTALVPTAARRLLGPKFALVRRTFAAHREAALARRDGGVVGTILVSFGATDPFGATNVALDAVQGLSPTVRITVALSSHAVHIDAVRRRLDGRTDLAEHVADLSELMVEADLAIGAAGATALERAAMGLPSVIVTVADNQRNLSRLMGRSGAAVEAGALDDNCAERIGALVRELVVNQTARRRMSATASNLVDGRGSWRVLLAMLDVARTNDAAAINLRFADSEDENWLLELQREPETRRFSRNPAVPDADEHHRWFRHTLGDQKTVLMIIEFQGARVGMLRLNRLHSGCRSQPTFEVSIAISASCWGRGIASRALAWGRRLFPKAIFEATVMMGNEASRRLFINAGYVQSDDNVYRSWPS